MKKCGKCIEYKVACSVLEGFECCRCCGISECEYDICPPDEKLETTRTKEEFLHSLWED